MDITAFIRELLFGHDCVIVPGFGGFIGNYTPAGIDKSTGTFHPPLKQISFNRNLNHNDGLLIRKICEAKSINYGDARTFIEEFVIEVRKKLERGEKVVFDRIGTFSNNHEGSIQFEPDRTVNYHLDSYGMETFQCFPLENYDIRKRITGQRVNDPVRQHSLRKFLWRAAVIIPLAGAMVAVSLKTELFKAKVEATSMNPLVNAEFENNKVAVDQVTSDTMDMKQPVEQIASEAAEQTFSEPIAMTDTQPAVVAEAEPAVISSYFIITGSFRSAEYADRQADKLKSEGFTPEIVLAKNGFYRVCAMGCPDMNTALTKKDSINKKFPGAWVSRKK